MLTSPPNILLIGAALLLTAGCATKPQATTKAEHQQPVQVVVVPPVEQQQNQDDDRVYATVEQTPGYPGGDKAMYEFIGENLRYPEAAKKAAIEGNVFVSMIINKEGQSHSHKVEKGIGAGCDEEALRLARLLQGWMPAKQNGRPVNYRHVVQLKFRL